MSRHRQFTDINLTANDSGFTLSLEESHRAIEDSEQSNLSSDNSEDDAFNVRINGESLRELLERNREVKDWLNVLCKYLAILLIILAKFAFDRFTSLLGLLLVWYTFPVMDRIVKRISALPENFSLRSALELLSLFVIIPSMIWLFYRSYSSNAIALLVLLPSVYEFHTFEDLLWIIIMTDYVIKLTTVFVKGFYAATSSALGFLQKQRGKHLALLELTSILYRSLVPIQPWLTFLLVNCAGIQKVFGVFLSIVYMVYKLDDIECRAKMLLNVLRSRPTPSKSQFKDAGNTCPICKDDFSAPIILQCKHIFCEECISRWFGLIKNCPVCRINIDDHLTNRSGATSHSIQFY